MFRQLAATREWIIGESYVRADEDIVLDRNTIPQLDAALDRNAITYPNVVLYKAVRANVAVSPDLGVREDHAVLPDACTIPDLAGLNIGGCMDECLQFGCYD